MERKVDRLKGVRPHDVQNKLQNDIADLQKQLDGLKKEFNLLSTSNKNLKDECRNIDRVIVTVQTRKDKLTSVIQELKLENEMARGDLEKVKKTKELQWTELLDKIAFKLLIGQNSEGRAHILTASCHPTGHVMVMSLIKNSRSLSSSVRTNLMTTISSYRTVLSADNTGCQVFRAAKDLK